MYCIYCGVETQGQAAFCPRCGRQFRREATPVELTCTVCHARNPSDAVYCWNCGKPLERENLIPPPLPGVAPGAASATSGNAPMIQGTPQIGQVPSISGSPQMPTYSAGNVAPSGGIPTENMAPGVHASGNMVSPPTSSYAPGNMAPGVHGPGNMATPGTSSYGSSAGNMASPAGQAPSLPPQAGSAAQQLPRPVEPRPPHPSQAAHPSPVHPQQTGHPGSQPVHSPVHGQPPQPPQPQGRSELPTRTRTPSGPLKTSEGRTAAQRAASGATKAAGVSRRAVLAGVAGGVVVVAGAGIALAAFLHNQQGPSGLSASSSTPTTTRGSTPTSAPTSAPSPTSTTPPRGTVDYTYTGHSGGVRALAWSKDGKRIASASLDHTGQVWDAPTGKNAVVYRGHSAGVEGVAWSPDSTKVVTGSDDTTAQIWDPSSGNTILTYRGHSLQVNRVGWSPDGKYIVSGEQATALGVPVTVHIWDASNGNTITVYRGHTSGVFTTSWSPDGTRIASDGYDGTVQVWEALTGNPVSNFNGGNVVFCGLSWSPDGQHLAVAGSDNQVRVLDAAAGQQLVSIHAANLQDVTWSPDGKLLAAGETGQVELFDPGSGSHVYTQQGQTGDQTAVAWSPGSNQVASGSSKGPVQVWQAV